MKGILKIIGLSLMVVILFTGCSENEQKNIKTIDKNISAFGDLKGVSYIEEHCTYENEKVFMAGFKTQLRKYDKYEDGTFYNLSSQSACCNKYICYKINESSLN